MIKLFIKELVTAITTETFYDEFTRKFQQSYKLNVRKGLFNSLNILILLDDMIQHVIKCGFIRFR